MATVDPRINDTLTQVQLRLLRQRLEEERGGGSTARTPHQSPAPETQTVRLHQAMLRRQELLDRIQHEQVLGRDLGGTRSHTDHHSYKRPVSPRRAESLPPPRGGGTPRQVVEHQFRPIRLDPMEQPPPKPQVIHTQVPAPYIMPSPEAPKTNTKGEMMEMMMMQNAQMHQMMMNQLMVNSLPKPAQNGNSSPNKLALDIDDILSLRQEKRRPRESRPPSVHHHHYDPAAPHQPSPQQYPQNPGGYYTLPPINVAPPMQYPAYPSPRYYPVEVEPLKYPQRARRKKRRPKTPPVIMKQKVPPPKPRYRSKKPFPGSWAMRKFRHAAYAVWFAKILEKAARRRKPLYAAAPNRSEDFLFGIRLKEAVAALHTIYLEPASKMSGVLRQYTTDASRDLTAAFGDGASSSERKNALEDLGYVLENITFEITEIMPSTGVLGTHQKAVVFEMTRSGKLYPQGYFWQLERDLLDFDQFRKTINIGEFEMFMLLVGMFVGRALVTTLLLKPVEYGLTPSIPNYKVEKNLKLIATLFVYLVRKCYAPAKGEPQPIPYELDKYIYKDEDLQKVLGKLKSNLDYSENLMRNWGREYVKRLRGVASYNGS